MRLLIAEDEYITRMMVQVALEDRGYHVDSVDNGDRAWEILQRDNGPEIAILDWEIPGQDGLAVCRRVKELERSNPVYVIMLTSHNERENILGGFAAGADDYMTKPFDENELCARVRVAERLVGIQKQLTQSNQELRAALDHLGAGGIGVYTRCGQIESEDGRWLNVAAIIREKTDDRFRQQLCPSCLG